MSRENKDILFEGRDTQDKKIFILGIWLFAVMGACSLLMIPLVHYLWEWAESANPRVEKTVSLSAPTVILETHPSRDYQNFKKNTQDSHASEKIDAAVKTALAEGYPVKS
ncbi:MAG TPA: hypothetical protein PLY88_00605 [Candidatus Omnitrophota bacterium]|nr:hypothetical protein [Candidatus Omnitrophota bacterium]HRK61032.1 hypothetical protein [Candidatus Omnitrophota bacterium]